ncbi:hypothetical protein Tco_1203836 [Tanacetum coccineum]
MSHEMEHYLAHTDYPIWEVIQNGNGPISITTDTQGQIKILPPRTAEEILARERERKARTTFLMVLPKDHLAKFHKMTDAKEMWEAIKSRFGGNEELKKNKANDNSKRLGKKEESNALMTLNGGCVDWTSHSEDEQDNYAFMACNSSGSDTEEYRHDTSSFERKVEAQLVAHQQGQLEAEKEKEDLKAKVEKWHNSSKNLGKLLNTQMSANDKFGLGYGDYRYDGILSYENEVLQSVFMNKESDLENQPLYDRFVTAEGMHVVPPPMTGNYMPSGPDIEIDYSQFTYGPKQSQTSESETQTSDFDTCESDFIFSEIVISMKEDGSKQAELTIRMRKKYSKGCLGNSRTMGQLPTNWLAMKVNIVKPIVNNARLKGDFCKSVSPFRKSLNKTTTLRTKFSYQKVNTTEVNAVSAVGGKRETAVKPSAGCNWRPKRYYWHKVSKYNSGSMTRTNVYFRDPQGRLKSAMAWVPKRN